MGKNEKPSKLNMQHNKVYDIIKLEFLSIFKGKIYLLVDKYVYSSSEMMASFAKESNMATLVGERTGGDGIGSDSMLIDLPNSGYILRFSKEMGVTEKGSINEMDQTQPDILVSDPVNKINFGSKGQAILNGDKAIIAVLEEEGINPLEY